MRKLLVLVLCLALDATCFAQHRGGSRGGGGFSGRGYVSGHGSGMGGYRGSGWGHYGGGWSGGYRPFYGYRSWNRFSFGLGYGYGYTPWSYWPGSYWDYYGWYGYPYDPYPYWYGYPYVYDPDPPAAGVRVIVHSRRSASGYRSFRRRRAMAPFRRQTGGCSRRVATRWRSSAALNGQHRFKAATPAA